MNEMPFLEKTDHATAKAQTQSEALMLCPHLQNFLKLRYVASFWRNRNFRVWFFNTQGLSKREGEIGALIFDGLELAQIAKQLFISEATIREHLKKIYLKMGVHSRTEMFAAYINTCRKTISDSLS